MNKKITLKEFFDSNCKLAIKCSTEEEAKKLLRAFDRLDKRWTDGNSYLGITCWKDYRSDTCYSNSGYYADVNHYAESDYQIYNFEDVILEDNEYGDIAKKVFELLGVEPNEDFRLKTSAHMLNDIFYINENLIVIYKKYQCVFNNGLISILNGKYKIVKL